MKRSTSWHESVLECKEKLLDSRKTFVQQELNAISRIEAELIFLKYQIEEAKRNNLLSFDRDEYLKGKEE